MKIIVKLIQLTFKSDVQSQIDEILSFNIEVFGDGGGGQISVGPSIGSNYANIQGNWYHRFKLYFGAYNYTLESENKGYSTFDDKGRAVGTPQDLNGRINDTYLPENSLILDNEPSFEFSSGIYLEKFIKKKI